MLRNFLDFSLKFIYCILFNLFIFLVWLWEMWWKEREGVREKRSFRLGIYINMKLFNIYYFIIFFLYKYRYFVIVFLMWFILFYRILNMIHISVFFFGCFMFLLVIYCLSDVNLIVFINISLNVNIIVCLRCFCSFKIVFFNFRLILIKYFLKFLS